MMKSLRHYTLMLLIIALLTVAPLTAGAAATSSVSIKTQAVSLKFDGQSLSLPDGQYAFIYQNRTYIPIRFISYALQKSVKWDQKTSKVTVSEPTAAEKEALAKLLAGATAGANQPAADNNITIKPVQATLVFDGQSKALPSGQSLYSFNNSIYVPLRFMSEAVGTDIKWDQKTNSITGESEAYKAAQAGGGTTPGGNTGGGTGGTDPVGEVKPTYDSIAASATTKFTNLESKCSATLTDLYYQHKAATDETVKKNLEDSGRQTIAQCTADFNVLVADIKAELTKYGYSADEIIAQFTEQFNYDMALIKSLAGGMLG
ncbi:copper amine oxidase N-terminal domain-containing protein [Paenibacillus glycanilyticus]|uniref:stalk domain-containing protein n=1 Tax=Paenibacillus glycanilyticus TaxID=126569 RepID=UPI00203F465D|nr:stalk domain-containing protein [Paenibacillus glycanilyticus]MCM3630348.1 copper amine oxidase N-terminal domain-containing protein [Paenibacillus glycanilyticus]